MTKFFSSKIGSVVLSGILLGLSYPSYDPIPTGILAWFAFVPFLIAHREESSFKKYLTNASLFIALAFLLDGYWLIYYSFKAYLIGVFSQFYFFVFPLIVFHFLNKQFGWKNALFLLPFVWTLTDWLAHIAPHGTQVYLLPYTQANNTWLVQFIDKTGMWGITFWVVTMNVLILLFIETKSKKNLIFAIIWFVLPLFYSLYIAKLNPKSAIGTANRKSKVSIIQTNQDSYSTGSTASQKTFDEIVSLSDSAVKTSQPDLIVLPEAAIPVPLFQNKSLLDFTKNAIANWQTSVAIGFVEFPDSTKKHIFRNNALVFTPQLAMFWDSLRIKAQDVKVYQKRYGLPFVELMPYFETQPTVRGSAMERGTEPYTFYYANFAGDKFKVALTICWEQMYPHRMAELVNDDAEFVALLNNDAWFEKSGGAKQLLAFTRLRAIENRRSIVRCSNGGISCFIDPFGRISGKLPWFTSTIGIQEVLCVSKKSFFTRHPEWFPKFCGVLLLILILFFYFKPLQ
ncbi:MAG: apolipoprotein N-acyltransferase [Spirosomataceae bacterium]|jgi:apolipoprotein N-acyltransferase